MTGATGNGRQVENGRKRLMLVDGYGLAFRAFHALPMSMSTAAGEITNATFGFASMLLDVLRVHEPECALITFDVGRSFRHEQFQDYKAHRAPMAEEMRGQMTRIREVIAALNIPVYEMEGFEADDVIGTLAKQAADQGMLALVVTGDSDLLQLVNDNVIAVLPGTQRFGEYRIFDRQAVVDRYGFGPERLAEYKALVGDKSDNIPGVPGIGEKTAKGLIEKYDSIEDILAHSDEIMPTRARNSLVENSALAYQCRELATIVTDVPVELEVERCHVGDYDREKVIDLFRMLEFRSLANKLPDSSRATAQAAVAVAAQHAEPVTIRNREELESLAHEIEAATMISLDVETDGTSPITSTLVGIAIATADDRAYYIPVLHATEAVADSNLVREIIGPALAAQRNIVTHHGKFDVTLMQRHGYPDIDIRFDTMLAAYLLGENGIGLKDLAFRYRGWEMTPITDLIGTGRNQITRDNVAIDAQTTYAGADVEATLRLLEVLQPQLVEREQMSLLEDMELPLVPVLIEMELAGIAIDTGVLEEIDADVTQQIASREREIYEAVGREFNIGSTKQLGEVLFDELKLPTGRKTKTGYSVGQEVLDGLRGEHPAVDAILQHRSLKKLKSTYIDALPLQVNPKTGRIHTTYNQTIASTGRLSSVDPNLQNIPIRTDVGRQIRRAFVADNRPAYRHFNEESVFLSVDYSQMELRIMAHFSGDPALVSAFQEGLDVHTATAAEVFNVPIDDVSSAMRSTAKSVNFGIMYGMQAYGLSRDTGMPRDQARQFIDDYMNKFKGVRDYLDRTLREAVRNGYAESLYGRRRYLPEITASGPRRQAAERAAINMPLQGTASDIMKLAMIQVADKLKASSLRGAMLLQVHDELLFETPKAEIDDLRALVTTTMENVSRLSVPLGTEASWGPNWEDMRDFA